MGTNYYVKGNGYCRCCKQFDETDLHIGKSSGGWCFALQTHPEMGINTIDDWKAYLVSKVIQDEYGQVVLSDEMLRIIELRSWTKPTNEKYLARNHAVQGPNNLLRHKVDGSHCVGHGAGTYDYMAGEFF